MSQLWAPIIARQRKYPDRKIRPELLQTFAQGWECELSAAFRLAYQATIKGAKGTISETRISISHLRPKDDPDWPDKEAGASILTQQAMTDSHGVRLLEPPVVRAMFSLHAVARRIERGRGREDTALMRDMSCILARAPDTAPPGFKFIHKFTHADDSGWRGHFGIIEPERIAPAAQKTVLVRTWV
jgi:hypothetical protein